MKKQNKQQNSSSEEAQYQEITDKKQKQKVLENQQKNKQKMKRQWVKDDRQRVKVIQQQKRQQNIQKKAYVEKNKQKNQNNNQQRINKQYKQKQNTKIVYIQKESIKIKPRIQRQVNIKSQQITLECYQQRYRQLKPGYIYIGKRSLDQYIEIVQKQLNQNQVVNLISFGFYVNKAIKVAGQLGKKLKKLKQVNVPKTAEVFEIRGQQKMKKTKGAIRIKLSLHELNSHHYGYQQYNVKPIYKQRDIKQGPKYVQKSNYEAKNEKYNNYKSKQSEKKYNQEDERSLR